MGVPPYLLSSSILAVLAQRLVRVLCPACKRAEELPVEALPADCRPDGARTIRASRAIGCEQCRGIGFRGRMGIFELMEVDESMQSLIARTSEANVVRSQALKGGMKTLRQDGIEKVLGGRTTLDEVLRVTTEEAAAS
jgi:type II secretory ATPase GspE/PulE/Tfp pilus assembly ATPase PilB-like protein